jgi:peptide/nickel transport system permease protein
MEDIVRAFPATFELATARHRSSAPGWASRWGCAAAVRRGGWPTSSVRVMGLIGYSVPVFWLGLMAPAAVLRRAWAWCRGPAASTSAYEFTVTPVTGLLLLGRRAAPGEWEAFAQRAVATWCCRLRCWATSRMAYISRMTRSFMLERAVAGIRRSRRVPKGLSEARIVWRHALRNAIVPLVTVVALSYAAPARRARC